MMRYLDEVDYLIIVLVDPLYARFSHVATKQQLESVDFKAINN